MTDDITDPKALQEYLDRLDLNIQAVRRRLKRFEDEFGMTSENFYAQHGTGSLGQHIEYAEWAGEYDMLQRLHKQYEDIQKRLE
jgi:hypothetical protein